MATHDATESTTSTNPDVPNDRGENALRRRSKPRRWILALVAVVLIGSVGVAAMLTQRGGAGTVAQTKKQETYVVSRGTLQVTVSEQGTLESSKNTEIKCSIRGGYGGRGGESMVTWVIPAGSTVKQGDELVRLDTKVIEETISLGRTDTNNAKAALSQAEVDAANAEVAAKAYLEGRFASQLQGLQSRHTVAQRNLLTSKALRKKSEGLFRQGFVTNLEVQAIGFTVTQAELELNVVKTEIDVLNRLTKTKEQKTLNAQLLATKERLQGRLAGLRLEKGRLELASEELERCVIKAPQDGLVIYPSTAKWRRTPDVTAGASVHNNQVLLLMPDLTRMQIKVAIHESVIDRVKKDMSVKVKLSGRTLDAKVALVNAIARPAGWWTGNAVKYETIVKLPSEPGLNPGMTADVEVVLATHRDVLFVPTRAVISSDAGGKFCWVKVDDERTERRSLELGDSNDEFVVVEKGLSEGDVVVKEPLATIAEAREVVGMKTVHTLARGDMDLTLTEQGALESYDNTQIKCRVRGNSTINWVIENGSYVKKGDELVLLENKQIEDFLHERTKFAHLSEDAAIGFRTEAMRKGLAVQEYLQGTFVTELLTLEKDMAISQARLRTAENQLNHEQSMRDRGYASELDVEQRQIAVKAARQDVAVKETQIKVLKNFSKREQLATLQGEWESAKASAAGHEEVLKMDKARMKRAEEEMAQCTIIAPKDGLVIYPSTAIWKEAPDIDEGATVHSNQVLMLMPDLNKMQVKFGVHETMVDKIKPGMKATVRLPKSELEGEVTYVASATRPAGWWTGNIVKYDALIKLPASPGLKPGMSAEVAVKMQHLENVLQIPVEAVVRTSEGDFCWVGTPAQAERRSLKISASNNEFMAVESGVSEGEQVVMNPADFFDEADKMTSAAKTDQRP